MTQAPNPLSASIQALTLPRGLHLVSVTAGSPQRFGDLGDIVAPAVHVGVGPGASDEGVEILPGPRNRGHWLYEVGDTLVIRVSSGQADMLLTTVRADPASTISIEVVRLDRKGAVAQAASPPEPTQPLIASYSGGDSAPPSLLSRPAPPPPRTADGRQALGVRMVVHIQNKGDTEYVNHFWAGALGERLAIEAFAITPLEGPRPDQIEYIALSEAGAETGWVDGGLFCGRKGVATALSGFAVRIKPTQAESYECEYRGSFSSGRLVGPVKDGAPCRSDPGDRLEAIQLFILPRQQDSSAEPPPSTASLAGPVEAADPEDTPRPIGPRFSVFREPTA